MKFTLPCSVGLFAIAASAVAPLTTDRTWLYQGCYSAPEGHILDLFVPQNLTSTSIASCLSACGNSTKRYAALGDGHVESQHLSPIRRELTNSGSVTVQHQSLQLSNSTKTNPIALCPVAQGMQMLAEAPFY